MSFLVPIILLARGLSFSSPSQLNLNKCNFISRVRLCGLRVQILLRTQISGTHSLPLLPCGSQGPSSFSSLEGEDWGLFESRGLSVFRGRVNFAQKSSG